MLSLLKLFRSVVFLGWLCIALASTTIAAGVWAVQLSATVATMSANAAAAAIAHRKQLAKTVAKTKAKARLRRVVAAIPVVGVGALAFFEEQDYQEWLLQNPEGTRQQYACQISILTAEVLDEVLQELPELMRPEPEAVQTYIPECE
ncbi:hypothetical protein MB818_21500 [Ruegeria sp. 1NDH52C]|uniref:Uncharacterized protein n=2 Tax=Ruegeria alba TaxID=2916756 RepID=A0ABS9P3V1_9RHOB|nr:hypothetical protein [Ruegeria alba]